MTEDKDYTSEETRDEAEKIAEEGSDVRERIRELVLDSIKKSKTGIEGVSKAVSDIFDGVAAGIKDAIPEDQKSILRQTFDGLVDASSTAANAARLAFEEASARGVSFAKEDLNKTVDDLKQAETLFLDSIEQLAKRGKEEIGTQLKGFVEHARRTGTDMRPSVEAALDAALKHPGQLAGETFSAGAAASRNIAGQFLHAMSDVLEKAGDALLGSEVESEKRKESAGSEEDSP